MKIAIFTDVFLEVPGGIPSSIEAQRRDLEKQGHEVTIFCPAWQTDAKGHALIKGKKDAHVYGVPTHPLLRPGGAPLSKRPAVVKRWVRKKFPRFNFDLVHSHYELSCSIAGMQLAKEFKKPLVQTMHGREDVAEEYNIPFGFRTIVASLLCFLHKRCIPHYIKTPRDHYLITTRARQKMWEIMVNHAQYADLVITPSMHFREKFLHYGLEKPVEIVSNGILDSEIAKYPKEMRKYRRSEQLELIWNNRVSKEKRIMPLLKAMTLVPQSFNFFLSVYGDGNQLNKAKRYARRHHLGNRVQFFGRVPHDEVLEKMQDKHASVMVSYGFDNQSMTILEARAMGVPTMYCDPDMREVVSDKGAILTNGPSPYDLAEGIVRICEWPLMIDRMSQACLKRRDEVLQSAQSAKLLSVYESLLNPESSR